MRWWDGTRWTDYVAPNTAQHQPPPPSPVPMQQTVAAEKPKRVRKAGRRISWLAFGTFVVLVGVIAVALSRGQDVEYVDLKAGKVGFIGTKRVEVAKVEERSGDLERRVQQLESDAQGDAQQQQATDADTAMASGSSGSNGATSVNLTGDWSGESDFVYRIQQYGNEVVVSETHPLYGTTGVGHGTFDGTTLSMDFEVADGSTGHADLTLDGSDRLEGTFANYGTGTRVTAVLTRE